MADIWVILNGLDDLGDRSDGILTADRSVLLNAHQVLLFLFVLQTERLYYAA